MLTVRTTFQVYHSVTHLHVVPRVPPLQMHQAKLFENQNTKNGQRRYGDSVHYHYMSSNSAKESYNGAKVVHSTVTEMISNVSSRKYTNSS